MEQRVVAEAKVRDRNQLTIPEPIARALEIAPGETFVVEVSSDDPDTLLLHRVRSSYAGVLRGLYGDPATHLKRERATWR